MKGRSQPRSSKNMPSENKGLKGMKVLTDHILKLGLLPGYESEQNTIILPVEKNKQTNKQNNTREPVRGGSRAVSGGGPGPSYTDGCGGISPGPGVNECRGAALRLYPTPRPAPPRPLPKGLRCHGAGPGRAGPGGAVDAAPDRKSTRLNSSHLSQSRMPSSA